MCNSIWARTFSIACITSCLLSFGCAASNSPQTSSSGRSVPLVVQSVAPATVAAGSPALPITVTGSGFTASSVIDVSGSPLTTSFVSATQLQAVVPTNLLVASGPLQIVVTDASGGSASSSSAIPFTVGNPVPVVASISLVSIAAGSPATLLTITGTSFQSASVASWNGTVLPTTFVSSTQITVTVPATSLNTGGVFPITVTNPAPGGGVSTALSFSVNNPAPVLTKLSSSTVATGKAATITLSGSGFVTTSVVQWNGSPRATTYVNAAALQVALSSADLNSNGNGLLTVLNPIPGGGTSSGATLTVTSLPIPAISGITLSVSNRGGCPSIMATISGTNLGYGDVVRINGAVVASSVLVMLPATLIQVTLLAPTLAQAPLSFTVGGNSPYGITSDPFLLSTGSEPLVAVCAWPASVYPNSNFAIIMTTGEVNTTAVPLLNLGTMPAGITLISPPPISVPSTNAIILFSSAASVVPGNYTIPFTAQAGTVQITGSIQLAVQSTPPPSFLFEQPMFTELALPIGTSRKMSFTPNAGALPTDYTIVPTLSSLPPGVTATISPSTVIPNLALTVTFTASATAPVSQNFPMTLTGTPSAAGVAPATSKFVLEVTPPPGSLADNRADFTSTAATPYAAVYDAAHNQIFASNPKWNRVDILSSKTHQIVGSIDIRDPRGIDLTPDNSTLWVATGSQRVYAVDTSTFQVTRYSLPPTSLSSPSYPVSWEGKSVMTLSDGSLLIQTSQYISDTASIWTVGAPTLTPLALTGPLLRSGDHSRIYGISVNTSACPASMYSVATKQITPLPSVSAPCGLSAINFDGSRVVARNNNGYGVYDGSLNLIGILPGAADSSGYGFYGGFVFSPDGATLYQIGSASMLSSLPVILTYDVATLTLKGTAPAISTMPVGVSQIPDLANPFAVDSTGMVLGIQNFGIGFDDSTYFQTYAPTPAGSGSPFFLTPAAGPVAGGTLSSPYGAFNLTPDIWYGQNRGIASLDAATYTLTLTSPLSETPGPVNLKYLYPDGTQAFSPQEFSYSTYPQYATLSAASPDGGVPGQITGYGMPTDASGGTLSVGGNAAVITTAITQYPPYTGEPFPSTYLNYTIPAGTPGWADLQIQTPIGTGTLAKSIFYAKSVTDYASPDTFSAVLYDRKRNQVYLAAKDHIDVFSMASLKYMTPLTPPIIGAKSQFEGLALTPDGSLLLAANTFDGSLAVINPDSPGSTYAIPVAGFQGTNNCTVGPLYVAATSNGLAFVVTGSLPGTMSCPSEGNLYIVNLATRAVTAPPNTFTCSLYDQYPFTNLIAATSSADGSVVVMGGGTYGSACLYSVATNTYTAIAGYTYSFPAGISGDGNIIGSGIVLDDPSGANVGRLANPVLYHGSNVINGVYTPRLNDSGSLYFWPYQSYFEIFDVPTGRLSMRFSLKEKIQNVAIPLALDAGHDIFLATDQGLTVVDLGVSPLSIGHLVPSTALAGSAIQVRGSGFTAGITGKVGSSVAVVKFTDESTLTVTVPPLSSGSYDLTLTNLEGAPYILRSAIKIP